MTDEIVEYLIVNKDVPMSKGKTAAQVSHVATLIALACQQEEEFQKWLHLGQKKIILRGREKDLLRLKNQGFFFIHDFGLTEIPAGTLTCVGLPPMKKSAAQPHIKRLQLLND